VKIITAPIPASTNNKAAINNAITTGLFILVLLGYDALTMFDRRIEKKFQVFRHCVGDSPTLAPHCI
jgi:hypothetical protein